MIQQQRGASTLRIVHSSMKNDTGRMRIDKWLWAARFFKTRSLAAQAVEGGKVEHNDARIKPAKELRAGDRLRIRVGEVEWCVTVRGISAQRGSASVAMLLYEEDAESVTRRQKQIAERKLVPHPAAGAKGRPTKKQRRQIIRFTSGE